MHHAVHNDIASKLVSEYEGQEPFASYIKKYFAANKKHGSRDRKTITALCYESFRKAITIFPLEQLVSKQINRAAFTASHQIQPLLFIRIRPWQKEKVIAKLNQAQIEYKEMGTDALSFANTTSLQNILDLDKEAVIQDINSQALSFLLSKVPTSMDHLTTVWDCCAASGGKTILMFDYMDNIQIHVSDIRDSILNNCDKRLQAASIRPASIQVIDLTEEFSIKKQFDFVFADLPCSGSGTWGRTPEQLQYFTMDQLTKYTLLQAQILQNIQPTIKVGGYLLVATCSVYENENEKQVEKLLSTGSFELVEQQYFVGYEKQSDTLFGALLKKVK
jgi:16S rRNA (cytosine967-C5)-methyltransferase